MTILLENWNFIYKLQFIIWFKFYGGFPLDSSFYSQTISNEKKIEYFDFYQWKFIVLF